MRVKRVAAVVDSNRSPAFGLSWLALFVSTSTLVCCALPILFVVLGFGSVIAAVTNQYPLLVTLSDFEGWMFSGSAFLLAVAAWFVWGRKTHCPTEPVLAARCQSAQRLNRWIVWSGAAVWGIGFSARFLLLPLRNSLGL